MPQPTMRQIQKLAPCRSMNGISRNMGNDGMTYQNVALECAAIRSASGLSFHSQTMPSTETSGRDATNAPNPGYRLARVEASAIRAFFDRYESQRGSHGARFLIQNPCW